MRKLGLSVIAVLCCSIFATSLIGCSSSGDEPEAPADSTGNGNGNNNGGGTVTDPEGYSEIPADPSPDTFTGFVHRALALQSTGVTCVYCPRVISAIHAYKKTYNDDMAVIVSAHGDIPSPDPMTNDYSNVVNNWVGASGFPTMTFNLNNSNKLNQSDDSVTTAKRMRASLEALANTTAKTGISAAVILSGDKKTVTVKAKVKIGEDGKYRIGAWLLEDGIYHEQSNAEPNVWTGNYTIHDDVLRAGTAKAAVGEALGKGQLAKDTYNFFTGTISTANVADLSKCRVVIYVTYVDPVKNSYVLDNIVTCQIGKTVAFEYKK